MIYTSADQLIGKTPLLELTHIEKELGLQARLLAKLEYFNPAGSHRSPNPPSPYLFQEITYHSPRHFLISF